MPERERRHLLRARHQVAHQVRRERLAVPVVADLLAERGRDALRGAAVELPLDDHRVQHGAAVVEDRVREHLHEPGLGVDLDDGNAEPVWPRHRSRVEHLDHIEARIDTGRQLDRPDICGAADISGGDRTRRRPGHVDDPVVEHEVFWCCFEHVGGDRPHAFAQHPGRLAHGRPTDRRRAAGARAVPRVRACVCVADDDVHLIDVHSDGVGAHLRKTVGEPLPHLAQSGEHGDGAVGLHAHPGDVEATLDQPAHVQLA